MSGASSAFGRPAAEEDGQGAGGDRPSLVLDAPGRLLIADPTGPPARVVSVSWQPRGTARSRPARLAGPGARRLPRLAPVDEGTELGTVALGVPESAAELPFLPWVLDPAEAGGGASGSGSPWRPDGDEAASVARRLAALLRPPTELLLAAEGPLEWPRPLLPYQMEGVRELLRRDSLLLADDMGLGKTIQATAALRILLHQRRIEAAVIVVPAGLLGQWRQELRRWAPELRVSTVHGSAGDRGWQWRAPAHVYLTSYETLRADVEGESGPPLGRAWDLVVLDEAQRIKNPTAEVSRACKRLRRLRGWALTGTPLENSPDDLLSILDFVDPGIGGGLGRFMVAAGLREQLGRVQLRRRKADVLAELPPKRVSQVVLPLAPRQRESYDRAEREGIVELRALGERLEAEHVFNLVLRLRQICNVCPTSGESSKLADLRERLATLKAEGHKALVFSQFANAGYGARGIATRLGPGALAYTGDLDPAERERVLHRFRTDAAAHVLVLSLRAGGQGLNLQEASYVFHVDRWWNPAVAAQAEGRSHRLGQRRPVNVYVYTSERTIEERIERILREKQLLFDELVDGVSLDPGAGVTGDDLLRLFGLAPAADHPPRAVTTDYAALSDGELADEVGRLLARVGWRIDPAPPGASGEAGFTATKGEGGETSTVVGRCAGRGTRVGIDTVRDVQATVRGGRGGRGVLVCPGGADAETAAFAADRGIVVWDAGRLGRLEDEALGIQREGRV